MSQEEIIHNFNRIAGRYDLGNDVISLGLHRWCRKKFCRWVASHTRQSGKVLDLATGTGGILIDLLKKRQDLEGSGIDLSEAMLKVGYQNIARELSLSLAEKITLQHGDARDIPFSEKKFDSVTVAWGIRNIKPMEDTLKEVHRVLKSGGWFFVLESGKPPLFPLSLFYSIYANLLPYLGKMISGDKGAYQYYAESVRDFPLPPAFMEKLKMAGFTEVKHQSLLGGFINLYAAQKPL